MAALHRYHTSPLAHRNPHVTLGKRLHIIMSTSPQQLLEEDRTRCLADFASLLGYYTLGNSHGLSTNKVSSSDEQSPQPQDQPQSAGDVTGALPTASAIATKRMNKDSSGNSNRNGAGTGFAFNISSAGRNNSSSNRVLQYLYGDDDDPIGGAICSFPSMEIQIPSPEMQQTLHRKEGGPPPLANITCATSSEDPDSVPTTVATNEDFPSPLQQGGVGTPSSRPRPDPRIPAMSASILDDLPAIIPSLPSLSSPVQNGTNSNPTDPTEPPKPPSEEQAPIAISLSRPTIWTRSSVHQAPPALLRSLATSFSALVDSRVQAWTLFLLRHSLSSNKGDKENRGFLLDMLETRTSIEVVAAVTTFTVLEEGKAKLRLEMERRRKAAVERGGKKKGMKTEDCDLVLPLRFEAVMDVSLQGRKLSVRFSAPGHIAAIFHENTSLISYVECKIDSKEFAAGMIEQTRLVLLEAVKSAASSDPKAKSTSNIQTRGPTSPASTPATSFTKLGGAASSASFHNMGRKSSFSSGHRSVGHNLMQSMHALERQREQIPEHRPNENMEQKRMIASASAVKMTKSSLRLSSLLTSRIDLSKAGEGSIRSKMGLQKKPSVVWKEGGDTIVNISNNNTPSSSMASSIASLTNANVPTLSSNNDWPDRIVKRQKLGLERPAMKRSVKSFGKPDSNDFCAVRNATFAEFGGMDNSDGMGRTPNALQKARQQAFGLKRSGNSNTAVAQGSRPGMLGAGKSMTALNATFEKNMNSSLSMSNSRQAGSMNGMNTFMQLRQHQSLSRDGQNPPVGALGELSLGKLRSQKSAQFERMLTVLQNREMGNSK